MKYFVLISCIYILFLNKAVYGQCFASPGNPVAGNANLGVLDKGIVRAVGFYQYSLSDKYYKENKTIDYNLLGAISAAHYNYTGLSVGYGISKKFTLEFETGYFINKTQEFKHFGFTERGYGLSNALLSGKYNVYKDVVKGWEFSVAAGAKMPYSTKPQIVDGVELSIDAQPSTGNYGAVLQSFLVKEIFDVSVRLIMINRYEKNFVENSKGYIFGDIYSNSFFLSKHLANPYTDLTKSITAILQLRHEYVLPYRLNGNTISQASGRQSIIITPQFNYNYKMLWNFSLAYDIPIYQYYNGIQLGKSYALTFSITKDFGYKI